MKKPGVPDELLAFAVKFAQEGSWRRCANCYLMAYKTCEPDWEYKYNCWSGFTSVLREQHFDGGEYVEQLNFLARDPTCRALDIVKSYNTKGQLAYKCGDHEAAARSYRKVLNVLQVAPADERQSTVLLASAAGMRPTSVQRLFDAVADSARFNLNRMLATKPSPLNRIRDLLSQPGYLRHLIPVGRNCADPDAKCAEKDKRTITAWRLCHNDACRAPGEHSAGDYVQINGLSPEKDLELTCGVPLSDDHLYSLNR